MANVVVALHGYNETVPAGFRGWKDVVEDRSSRALEVLDFFTGLGIDASLVVSGGTVTNERNEADAVYEHAKQQFPDIAKYDVKLEKSSKNTAENVGKVYEMFPDARMIVPVSSRGHIARVARDWNYLAPRSEVLVAPVASKQPYSQRGLDGTQPFIAEPPAWAIDLLPGVFKVKPDKREYFSQEFQKLLKEVS